MNYFIIGPGIAQKTSSSGNSCWWQIYSWFSFFFFPAHLIVNKTKVLKAKFWYQIKKLVCYDIYQVNKFSYCIEACNIKTFSDRDMEQWQVLSTPTTMASDLCRRNHSGHKIKIKSCLITHDGCSRRASAEWKSIATCHQCTDNLLSRGNFIFIFSFKKKLPLGGRLAVHWIQHFLSFLFFFFFLKASTSKV